MIVHIAGYEAQVGSRLVQRPEACAALAADRDATPERDALRRVAALCDAAEANTRGQHLPPPNDDIAYLTVRMIRSALALAGETP